MKTVQDNNIPKNAHNICVKFLLHNLLVIFIILSVIIGVSLGLILRRNWSHEDYMNTFYLEFPGRIFMNMLKMLTLPLIVSSVVSAMATLETRFSSKLGVAAFVYCMVTTMMAVAIGIALVLVFHPGTPEDRNVLEESEPLMHVEPLVLLLDLLRQLVPENMVTACFERTVTVVEKKSYKKLIVVFNMTHTVEYDVPQLVEQEGINVLGLVTLSIALGCVINIIGENGSALKEFFESLNAAVMAIVTVVIWYSPVGITFLLAAKFASTGDIENGVTDLTKYAFVILGGLVIHGIIVLPGIFFIITRRNPVTFALNQSKALLTAWGTASSLATLPVTMDCLIRINKVNIDIVRIIVPVGTTLNMDGTALYEAVACVFIAQVNGIDLNFVEVIIVSLTATAGAVSAAGMPQAGLITLIIVLTSVGLPTEDISLILSIDWLIDRFRTVINVWGDCIGAGILDHFSKCFHPYPIPTGFKPLDTEEPTDLVVGAQQLGPDGDHQPGSRESVAPSEDTKPSEQSESIIQSIMSLVSSTEQR